MRHASLFSGIGGFDIAARWMGWDNIFQCEIDEWCRKVLEYHFKNTILYGDIKKSDFKRFNGQIDVLSGSTPCQPFSVSGKRKGIDDDRHLWPEMLRVVRETRPRWVVCENVLGLASMVQPLGELELEEAENKIKEGVDNIEIEHEFVISSMCDDLEAEGYDVQPLVIPACGVGAPHRRYRIWFVASDHSNARAESLWQRRENEAHGFDITSYADSFRLQGRSKAMLYDKERRENKERLITEYTGNDRDGWRKINNWDNFPTQSPVCGGNDGLPFNVDNLTIPYGKWRKESIKAYGNAIVPQVAYEIFKIIEKVEHYYEQQTTL